MGAFECFHSLAPAIEIPINWDLTWVNREGLPTRRLPRRRCAAICVPGIWF